MRAHWSPFTSHCECTANVIAENLFSQVDEEGRQQLVLQEISDHRKDGSAIPISEGMFRTRSGALVPKKTTRGWELKVEWKMEPQTGFH